MVAVAQFTRTLHGAAETVALGRALASLLAPGDFVGLRGELGAGKTLLVRAVCEALGVLPSEISSPTFAVLQTYTSGRFPVHHVDLYRLHGEDELYGTGYFDLLGPEAAAIVEWIDRIPAAAPEEHLVIELSHETPKTRIARVHGAGARGGELARRLDEGPLR